MFQHSTQPQLEELQTQITNLYNFNDIVKYTLLLLYGDIVYLAVTAYDVLVYLVYLLTSIYNFNVLEIVYVQLVKAGLIVFMANIKAMLRKSCHYLHDLMNKLIKEFCRLINRIFDKIKSKLLYYLNHFQSQIVSDILKLSEDLALLKLLLSLLQSDLHKYKLITQSVNQLLKIIKKIIKHNKKLKDFINHIDDSKKIIVKLYQTFSHQNNIIKKIIPSLSPINLEKYIQSRLPINNLFPLVNNYLQKLIKHSSNLMKMHIVSSLITEFHQCLKSIKKLLKMNETNYIFDLHVSEETMSVIKQLSIVETIDLVKLYILINQIQLKYFKILIECQLLVCTLTFYKEIQPNMNHLCDSLKFESCNAKEFLSSCCKVENYIKSVSTTIDKCIIKLATFSNKCNTPNVLLFKSVLLNLIWVILILKFYVDLMAMEIIIFKNIILTLIGMSVSSVILDELIKLIKEVDGIDKAIPTLIFVSEYLRTFYFIQLENTLVIFALSNALKFSQSIHEHYRVLLFNLDLINRLIWVLECYINHLIVFRHVTNSLNSLINDVGGLGDIIDQISHVISDINKIIDKLNLVNKSIEQLKTVGDDMDITKWRESANKIRLETQSVSKDIEQINSEITKISGFLSSILSSWAKLLGNYYFLFVLISYVYNYILKNNDPKVLRTGILSRYLNVDILSVMEPCNKQLKFILAYLVDMWLCIASLIKFVGETLKLIYKEIAWSYGLATVLKEDVDKINKGVVGMECAIDGVATNFIQCTLLSVGKYVIDNGSGIRVPELDKKVYGMYSSLNVNEYNTMVNRMLEFWTFSDQSVELFKYIRYCLCALYFESKYRSDRPSTFPHSLPCIKTCDVNPVSEFGRQTMADNVGNHLCLCLVIKYHLRPAVLKCILYLRNEEFGTLDTISRKYERYNKFGCESLLWKLCGLVLNIIYELTSLLRNRYTDVLTRKNDSLLYELYKLFTFLANVAHDITYPVHQGIIANLSRCFCMYSNDPDYHYIISITLYLSSLIENIWTMDTETIRMGIEKISILYSQLEIYDLNSTSLKRVCYNPVYSLIVNKKCQGKESEKCCCCWCVTCYNLGIILIYLCLQFKLFNALCKEDKKKKVCEKFEGFCEVKECTCQQKDNGLCCLLKLATCSQAQITNAPGCKSLEQVLKECCTTCSEGDCCCKTLAEKASKGLCKVLLLGCECTCTDKTPGDEVKIKCVLFNDISERTSVAVVVFCKCKDEKCCLHTIIDELKKKSLDKICEEECVCEELKNVCDEICNKDCCEKPECPCKELKEKLDSICNGAKKGCGNDNGKCLCKEIKETIGKCFKDGSCNCKNKGCCKVLGASLRILSRARRTNILEPYKRITIDIMCSSKDKTQLVRSIVNGINQGTVNRIYLVKNNLLTSRTNVSSKDTSLTDVTSMRNWGYDTQYEHDVTSDNINDVYPNITSSDRTGYRNGVAKMFNMIYTKWNILKITLKFQLLRL